METEKINLIGIARALTHGANNGACDEMINLRRKDGAWRVIKPKNRIGNSPGISNLYPHVQDGLNNWVGWDSESNRIVRYDIGLNQVQEVILQLGDETFQMFKHLKRFLIVITDVNMYVMLWIESSNSYTLFQIVNEPRIGIETHTAAYQTTDAAPDADGLLGKYVAKLKWINEDSGSLVGGMFFRMAYRLFDGTYVMHTAPMYVKIASLAMSIVKSGGNYTMKFYSSTPYGTYENSYYQGIASLRNIIDSVVIFACKNEALYEINENTITSSNLATWLPGSSGTKTFDTAFTQVSESFRKMPASIAWYKILSVNFGELVDNPCYPLGFDLKGWYSDYATREVLPADNWSHHTIIGKAAYVYNDRLILGDTTTSFGLPVLTLKNTLPDGWVQFQDIESRIIVKLKTAQGEKRVVADNGLKVYKETVLHENTITGNVPSDAMNEPDYVPDSLIVDIPNDKYTYRTYTGNEQRYYLPGVVSYFDARAIQFIILVKDGGVWKKLKDYKLEANSTNNFAFYTNPESFSVNTALTGKNFDDVQTTVNLSSLPLYDSTDAARPTDQLIDTNRVQVSELQNPFVWPAKLSYQVGTGEIMAFGSNAEPLSTGQFGQFPLIVFTSKGWWVLEQGQGSILFSNVLPGGSDVIRNGESVSDVSIGVAFATTTGLMILTGRESKEISQIVEGIPNYNLIATGTYTFYSDHENTVQLLNKVTIENFLDYLQGATFAFDKINEEIIICNPDFNYTYLYGLKEGGYWTKIGQSFDNLISYYPSLYASNSDGLYNLSEETSGTVQFLLHTRPISFGSPLAYKKLHRSVLYGMLNTLFNKKVMFVIYASNDLKTWQIITGTGNKAGFITNLWATHSPGSYKYFVIYACGEVQTKLEGQEVDNYISGIDMEVITRYQDKLRAV